MDVWGWLVGYVVLFALFHLVLYYVYVRRRNDGGSPRPSFADGNGANPRYASSPDGLPGPPDEVDRSDDDRSDEARQGADDRPDGSRGPDAGSLANADDTVTCPHCGAVNAADGTFTYCRRCVSGLRR